MDVASPDRRQAKCWVCRKLFYCKNTSMTVHDALGLTNNRNCRENTSKVWTQKVCINPNAALWLQLRLGLTCFASRFPVYAAGVQGVQLWPVHLIVMRGVRMIVTEKQELNRVLRKPTALLLLVLICVWSVKMRKSIWPYPYPASSRVCLIQGIMLPQLRKSNLVTSLS